MKKFIIAATFALLGSSVAMAGNCQAIYPAKAKDGEMLTVKLPGKGDHHGNANVAVYVDKTDARIGGSAIGARWCESNRPDDAAKFAVVYSVVVDGDEIQIPVVSKDAWVRVYAGQFMLDGFRDGNQNEVSVALTNNESQQKKGE